MEGYMDARRRYNLELFAAWTGPIFVVLFAIFWGWFGQNLPHPEAHAYFNSQEIHRYYTLYQSNIRFGYTGAVIFVTLYFIFSTALAARSWRIEGRYPVWAFAELIGGMMTATFLSGASMNQVVASYRLDPVHVQVLNDMGWLSLDMQWSTTTVQMFAIAFMCWCDPRPDKEKWIPNWLAWYSVLTGLSFIADSYLPWIYDGPFGWSGWYSYHLTFADWLVWVILVCYKLIQEVNRYKDNPERMWETVSH